MEHIILVYGKWKVEKTKWLFEVDNERGSILVAANEDTRFEDLVKIIFEDYEVDSGENDLELRYVFPKRNLQKQSIDTPPVKIGNDRQLHAFLRSFKFAVGQSYDSKDALETCLKIYSVVQRFDFDVDRSTTKLFRVKFWIEGCTWNLRASPVGESSKFTIRVYVDEHTCSVTERSSRSRQATPDILGLLYKDYMGYWKARRTLLAAKDLVMGSSESGYQELPTYLHMIRMSNPGTLTRLEVDTNNRFKYLFLAFGASISGFPFLRKVVVVDGTFLQGKYKGTLLIATSQDGNFQIFPIAFAVVDTENDESWTWFFRQLSRVIPDDEGLALISDRHKSIEKAIAVVYPLASRRICTYHLYKNILLRYRGRDLFGLVKKAANSFRLTDFQATFERIKELNPDLHAYLERADVHKWARAHFRGDRYNLLTSNIAESINRALSGARSLPIVHLLESIRLMMTRWFATKKHDAELMKTSLTRGVEKLLEGRIPIANLLKVQTIDIHQSQVTGVSSLHVVNLTEKTCSCRRFDLEKLPCAHAIAAAEARKRSCISHCHRYYRKQYLYNAYSNAVMPKDDAVPIREEVATKICLPPDVRQPPGRPKKSRHKSILEKVADKKRPRKDHTCRICNQTGHNSKTCPLK
ncbi:hypothetical protein Bca101_020524 [Brassica carinata]